MPLFSGLVSCIKGGVNSAVDMAGKSAMSALSKKHPDIDEVLDTLTEMKAIYAAGVDADGDGVPDHKETEDDGKWRPMLLTLGLLYKLQRIQDSHADSWYNSESIFVKDDAHERRLLETFGFYWHRCMSVAGALRTVDNQGGGNLTGEGGAALSDEDVARQVSQATSLPREDVLFAHATDSLHVDKHCPDLAVLLLRELKQVLIVVCGTRMIPAPKMKDVFMDLYADTAPFLGGEAHMGMALGARNILDKIGSGLNEALTANPGFNVLVTGYSLGAGICQLLTMELVEGEGRALLPEGTEVRCVSFGAPPVFRCNVDTKSPSASRLFSVVYNNDGLASASVATVTKLFMQIRAVERLGMRRRDMVSMLWKAIPVAEGGSLNEDDEDDDDDFSGKAGSKKTPTLLEERPGRGRSEEWIAIRDAVNRVSTAEGTPQLGHPAGQVFIFKRRQDEVITRRLTDSAPLSLNLRLRGAMFSHHMPWGYGALFEGFGQNVSAVDLSALPIGDGANPSSAHLYPDLAAEN